MNALNRGRFVWARKMPKTPPKVQGLRHPAKHLVVLFDAPDTKRPHGCAQAISKQGVWQYAIMRLTDHAFADWDAKAETWTFQSNGKPCDPPATLLGYVAFVKDPEYQDAVSLFPASQAVSRERNPPKLRS